MRLYLVQHGEALPKDVDPDRPLSDQGRRDIAGLGAWLKDQGVAVHTILHSGKTRARETAELLQPLLAAKGEIREEGGVGPNDSPKEFLSRMQESNEDTLLASHLPFVARVVSVALTGGPDRHLVEFEPGSVAGLYRTDERVWRLFLFAGPDYF